jgi:hypothetical protein
MYVTIKFNHPIMLEKNQEVSFLEKVHLMTVLNYPEIVNISGTKLKNDLRVPISNISSYWLEK